MAISVQILGRAGRDNAVLIKVDSGQNVCRLLFDCGQSCLDTVAPGDIQQIEHVCFSHFHMDHVSGFDGLFRMTYNRPAPPMHVWGPPGTTTIMSHRFHGYLWNLHGDQPGQWLVHDIQPDLVTTTEFRTSEAFQVARKLPDQPTIHTFSHAFPCFFEFILLDHHTPSVGYVVREREKRNIDTTPLAELGLAPGPWLQRLKDPDDDGTIETNDGQSVRLAVLRDRLLTVTKGESFAYLSDFHASSDEAVQQIATTIAGCTTLVCESQYLSKDRDLALKNGHMTALDTGRLARMANVETLILIHISDRYSDDERLALLAEARSEFPNTTFPLEWELPA